MGLNFLKSSKTITSFELNCAQLKVVKTQDNDLNKAKSELILFERPIIEENEICDYKELKTALKYLVKKGFSSSQNILCVPSTFVFTNIVTLPFYSVDELKSIIHQEIPRQIPFDAANALTDFVILNKDSSNYKAKVLIAAIKSNFAKDLEDVFSEVGIKLNQISISSLNIINSLKVEEGEESRLILNFDWQNTDIAIMQNDLPVFYHSVSAGKENILKNAGFEMNYDQSSKIFNEVDLDMLSADFEPTAQGAQISLSTKNIYSSILGEINQILEFYYSQNETEAHPQNVILKGEGASLKGLEELVARKLIMKVQSVEVDTFEACKGVLKADKRLNINFLNKKLVRSKIIENVPQETVLKCKNIVTASCFAFAALMVLYLLLFLPLLKMKHDLKLMNEDCEKLKPQVEEIKNQSKELKHRKKIEEVKVVAKSTIDSDVMNWKQILLDISSAVPSNVKITQIDRSDSHDSDRKDGKQINIKGSIDTTDNESLSPISYFVLNINESLGPKSQMSDATIKSLQFNEETSQYEFEIQAQIQTNISEGLKE